MRPIHISSNILIHYERHWSSPDRGRLIALIQPILGGDDVHAPQAPVVAVGSVGVLLHFKRVVLDVVDGGKDDAAVVLFHPGQDGFGPAGCTEETQGLGGAGYVLLKAADMVQTPAERDAAPSVGPREQDAQENNMRISLSFSMKMSDKLVKLGYIIDMMWRHSCPFAAAVVLIYVTIFIRKRIWDLDTLDTLIINYLRRVVLFHCSVADPTR